MKPCQDHWDKGMLVGWHYLTPDDPLPPLGAAAYLDIGGDRLSKEMSPCLAPSNHADCSLVHFIFNRQCSLGHFAFGEAMSNLYYLLRGQLCKAILFAWVWVASVATFSHLIHLIICLRAKKQMRRVHASSIVAMMTYAHSFWDWAVNRFPRQPMRKESSPDWCTAYAKLSITAKQKRACPFPTFRPFLNFRPEAALKVLLSPMSSLSSGVMVGKKAMWATALVERLYWLTAAASANYICVRLRLHGDLLNHRAAPRAVSPAPGLSLAPILARMFCGVKP